MFRFFQCFAMLLFANSTFAQLQPGEYVTGGAWGVLRIGVAKGAKGGAQLFEINARGANFHSCTLDGAIRGNEARMEESADDKRPCIVTFKPVKGGLDVQSKSEGTCRYYCGARANFEGEYVLAPAGCAPSRINDTRKRFKAAFDGNRYSDAHGSLAPVLARCKAQLSDYAESWVRNDLALTQHRLNDNAACRATLSPLMELASKPDKVIEGDYPPSDAEEYLSIAKATRYNMKLCGATVVIKLDVGK